MTLRFSLFSFMNVIPLALQSVGSVGVAIGIWLGLLLCIWRLVDTLKQGTSYVRRLHQIPCSRCAYFTGDYRLKCTVHPMSALTEEAIGCMDYDSKSLEFDVLCAQNSSPYRQMKGLVKR